MEFNYGKHQPGPCQQLFSPPPLPPHNSPPSSSSPPTASYLHSLCVHLVVNVASKLSTPSYLSLSAESARHPNPIHHLERPSLALSSSSRAYCGQIDVLSSAKVLSHTIHADSLCYRPPSSYVSLIQPVLHDLPVPDLMTSRLKAFGGAFGSKRTSSSNNNRSGLTPPPQTNLPIQSNHSTASLTPSTHTTNGHTPQGSSASTTSLPMNNQGGLGRPPSYTYNPNAPRTGSPLPPGQQMGHHPPPINTGGGGYSQGHPALGGGGAQPPGYGYGQVAPQSTMGQYGGRSQPVEVEGAGRSKAQLIVGIDFVRISHNFQD